MEMGPAQKAGSGLIRIEGLGGEAVRIFLKVGQMAPVLVKNSAVEGQGPLRVLKLQAQPLPQKEKGLL